MSISPPSDIVLDVALAADPVASNAAAQRLTSLRQDIGSSSFETLVAARASAAGAAPLAPVFFHTGAGPASAGSLAPASRSPMAKAYSDLESFFLQTAIGSMMPSGAQAVFGGGIAGSVWKSMLAEQVAKKIAASGGLGLFAHRGSAASQALPGQAAAAPGWKGVA